MFASLGVPDWVIWYTISQYVGLALFGGYWIYKTRFKIGFKAVFVRKVGQESEALLDPIDIEYGYAMAAKGEWQVVGSKEFKATAGNISFRKKSFTPNLEAVAYRKHGFQILVFDYDSGSCLTFGGEVKNVEPEYAERHLTSGALREFLSGSGVLNRTMLIMLLVVVVAVGVSCGLGGYIFGNMENGTIQLSSSGLALSVGGSIGLNGLASPFPPFGLVLFVGFEFLTFLVESVVLYALVGRGKDGIGLTWCLLLALVINAFSAVVALPFWIVAGVGF